MKKTVFLFVILLFALTTFAQVRLPRIIRDSMILQRDEKINLWGWASPAEKISIRFDGRTYKTKAGSDGKWKTQLPAMHAGGPYTMDISASNQIKLRDILLGDVWFCSGQSNMVHQMNIHDVTYAREIAEANYPEIRQFLIPTLTDLDAPQTDLPAGSWQAAEADNVRPFSAVAYFFAKSLYEKYKVPLGIINASVGGSPIEAWLSESGAQGFPAILTTINRNKDASYIDSLRRSAPIMPPQLTDAGSAPATQWSDPAYVAKGWRNINIPGFWEDQGLKDLNGIVWYRREITIPASMAGKAAKVFLGRIVDADEFYINGKRVGSTGYQYPQRRYHVPEGILKTGKNLFVVRVTNTGGKGGFVPDKPYSIFSAADTIDLKGTWQYKVGIAFRPIARGRWGGGISAQNQPSALYNAMVVPEINYGIKGVCWYQGESNAGQPALYARLQPALIRDWRSKWNKPSLPFLFVQLPGFMDYNYLPSESDWAGLRESQLMSLAVPNTGMAVAIDVGEWNDIHPDNKKAVGERLALAAMKVAYKETLVYSGPVYDSSYTDGNKIIISFTSVGSGLATSDGEQVLSVAIAGADKRFVWAKTRIEGNKLVVWSDEIREPVAVRYAWADNPVDPNLVNKEGLPASPFRTDKDQASSSSARH